jgi:hypothetical protein
VGHVAPEAPQFVQTSKPMSVPQVHLRVEEGNQALSSAVEGKNLTTKGSFDTVHIDQFPKAQSSPTKKKPNKTKL